MTSLLNEVHAMQNPALGGALVWRFACGYTPESTDAAGLPLPLAFIVLPLVLHSKTRQEIQSTQLASGLRKFEEKFSSSGDLILAMNDRAIGMRQLTLASVRQALAAGLLTLLPEQGTLWPRSYTAPVGGPSSVQQLLKASEKLGTWCADLTLFEVSGILRLEF